MSTEMPPNSMLSSVSTLIHLISDSTKVPWCAQTKACAILTVTVARGREKKDFLILYDKDKEKIPKRKGWLLRAEISWARPSYSAPFLQP